MQSSAGLLCLIGCEAAVEQLLLDMNLRLLCVAKSFETNVGFMLGLNGPNRSLQP